ncbi:transcriptional regulator with XRE-family HTH domain [Actinoplanes tereljensis]|nr:helix-turn-helix transcriptional regulator [Actinoplanes tereljensis]
MIEAMPDSPDSSAATSTPEVGPAVARELVRFRLKQLREASELSPATVAEHTGWSISKLARIEKGEVTVQPLEVRALLTYYGVDDPDEMAALARLSQASRTRQWYSKHRLEGDFQRFVAYESEAKTINVWQMLFIPGLLQTREYAHAVTGLSTRRSPDDKETLARVKLRMDRQQAFQERLAKSGPPRMVAVIDEAVLRRPIGGRDALRRQLTHLLELAAEPAYSIGVIPIDMVHQPGIGGNFELLQFGGERHKDVLFVEAAAGADALITDKERTELFQEIFKDLLAYGRTGEDAIETIEQIRDSIRTP